MRGDIFMKKKYTKPTLNFMELRPEEKIALCSWNVGVLAGAVPGCTSSVYSSYPEAYRFLCAINNAPASGS